MLLLSKERGPLAVLCVFSLPTKLNTDKKKIKSLSFCRLYSEHKNKIWQKQKTKGQQNNLQEKKSVGEESSSSSSSCTDFLTSSVNKNI